MSLPVTPTLNPKANPVVALGVIGSAVTFGLTSSVGMPVWARVVLVALILTACVVTQVFTTPPMDAQARADHADHADPDTFHAP